jgi:hypothetical protein
MTRKLALVVGVLLGSVPAAGLLAQTPAAKPNPSSGMQHATSVKPAQQDSAASKSAAKTHHAAWTKDQIKDSPPYDGSTWDDTYRNDLGMYYTPLI